MKKRKIMVVSSLENVNTLILTEKLSEFIKQSGVNAVSDKCRIVKMSLCEKVHHFPLDTPFIAAVMDCEDGKQAVFYIKRKKFALVEGSAVSSSKSVGSNFEIDGIKYVLEDTLNEMPRYRPVFPKNDKTARKPVDVE
ncbi:MAG: hypothetical protein IJ830_04520 [Alphaproteobacteria bacterium]|nr:hypothetical protein [Alphaproteobacteria bacterium]